MVVVLPVPLTPTTMTTAGPSARRVVCRVRSMSGCRALTSSSASSARSSPWLRVPRTCVRVRSRSTISVVDFTPTSAVRRASSTSSHASSSSLSRDSTVSRPRPSAVCERARRARSRRIRPAVGSGTSSSTAAGASATLGGSTGAGRVSTGARPATGGGTTSAAPRRERERGRTRPKMTPRATRTRAIAIRMYASTGPSSQPVVADHAGSSHAPVLSAPPVIQLDHGTFQSP